MIIQVVTISNHLTGKLPLLHHEPNRYHEWIGHEHVKKQVPKRCSLVEELSSW